MKKKLCILLAGVITVLVLLTVLLWPKYNHSDDNVPFLIGQLLYRTTDPDTVPFSINRKAVTEAAGGQLVVAEMSDTPESMISGVEDLIEMGCKGIILTPVSNAILPQIMNLCDNAHVYWIISMRPIHNEGLFEMLSASPYFLGTVSEDDSAAAEQLVRKLADQNVQSVVIYSISNENAAIEARELAIKQACSFYGISILEELVNIKDDTMLVESVKDLLALYPDLDGIISLSNSAIGQGLPILETIAGSSLYFASFDSSSDWSIYFDQGIILGSATVLSAVDAVTATSLLIHAIQGYPISEHAMQVTIPYSLITSSADLANVAELDQTTFLSSDQVETLLAPDATWEDFVSYQDFCTQKLSE